MKRGLLWKVSVRTPAAAEDAVADLMASVFGQPACIFTDAKTRATHVAVYLAKPADLGARKRLRLLAGLRRMRLPGLGTGRGRISVTEIHRENWATSWKHHFKPMEVGRVLLIKPSWSRRRERPGQAAVVLDPGLSFGTGQHPTTRFCLEQTVACRRPGQAQSFLDIGSGSGILAIAARKLGYCPVVGIDSDPEAVRIARSNARLNGVSAAIQFRCRDLAQLPTPISPKYDLICANLTSESLLACQYQIITGLRSNSWLVLAGILVSQFSAVQNAYEACGLRLVKSRVEQEWKSGLFMSPPGGS